jgi:hypothetical protein
MIPNHSREVGATALLVVRVWREAGGLRARVRSVADLEHGMPLEFTTASADELEQFVRQWLSDVLGQ